MLDRRQRIGFYRDTQYWQPSRTILTMASAPLRGSRRFRFKAVDEHDLPRQNLRSCGLQVEPLSAIDLLESLELIFLYSASGDLL
jgi:hypothetical protein